MLSKLNSLRDREEGFTLIELLIVVIIIGILAAIALPIFIDQQKVAVDASVQSDVRNSVTNITNAQAQDSTTTKAAVSNAATSVALTAVPRGSAAGTVATTKVATKDATELSNVPVLGGEYTVQGWNAGGKKYLGTADAGRGAFGFDSTTGKFTQVTGAAPSSGSTGGSTGGSAGGTNANTVSTGFEAGDAGNASFTNVSYSTVQVHSGARSAYTNYKNSGDSQVALVFNDANMVAGEKYKITGYYYVDGPASTSTDVLAALFPGAASVRTDVALQAGSWTAFSTTITVPDSLNSSFKQMYFMGNDKSNSYQWRELYFDDMTITPLS